MDSRLKIISLFSGCGGFDLGMLGGFEYLHRWYPRWETEIVFANDIDPRACETYAYNLDEDVVCGDIVEILKDVDLPAADIVIGGFPCQDFSLAGKREGLTVERGQLYSSMVEVVRRVRPKVFVAENVKGILSWENGLAVKTILEDFSELGYNVNYVLLNCADYGVPQNRERVFFIGSLDHLINLTAPFPRHTHKVTSRDALVDLEDDEFHFSLPNSGYSKAKKNNGSQGNKPINADGPAPTMRAEHHGNIEFHYNKDRRLSAREAARLQTFPDNFVFQRSTTDAYRQIGNAVPPLMGWLIMAALMTTFWSEDD